MNLKQTVLGGLAALAFGCASHMDKGLLSYRLEANGVAVPKYSLEHAAKEEGDYPFGHVEAFKVDRNKDKKVDLMDLRKYSSSDVPDAVILLVDTNYDGKVDLVCQDVLLESMMRGSDGKFETVMDAKVFYGANSGSPPEDEDLEMEEFKKSFFMPDEEE